MNCQLCGEPEEDHIVVLWGKDEKDPDLVCPGQYEDLDVFTPDDD